MQFMALLMRQGASRLILKGGMAMRALYGSTRLTKDVDFDCEDNVSQQSMQSHMNKALTQRVLERKRPVIMAKIEIIDFAMVAAELLPYIAPEIRQSIDDARWDEIRLDVVHHVERWMDTAIARAEGSDKDDHLQTADIDLAGR